MIRLAELEDAVGIARVEAAAADHPWSRLQIEATLDAGGWALVADEGAIVGHLLATTVAGEGELLTIAVHPDHRRRGLGRALLLAGHARWQEMGAVEVFLEVRADNPGAIALYTAEGWTPCGRRKGYYHDGVDAILMRVGW